YLVKKLLGGLFGSFDNSGVGVDSGGASDPFTKGFAGGGDFAGGAPIMVGEEGPELLFPRSAGTVIPHNQLSRFAGGGGVFNQFIDARGAGPGEFERLKAWGEQIKTEAIQGAN